MKSDVDFVNQKKTNKRDCEVTPSLNNIITFG